MSFHWNETNTKELRRLHDLGWTGAAIAQELGTTKSAVNTKRNRIGLSRSLDAVNGSHSATARRAAAQPLSAPTPPSTQALEDHMRTDGYTIMDKAFGGCRWPIGGEGADTRFCCRETVGTYCADHHQRAYTRALKPEELRDLKRRRAA